MKWKAVAAIIEPQNNDPKDLLNCSFFVSLIIPTTPVVTCSPYIHDGAKDGKVARAV